VTPETWIMADSCEGIIDKPAMYEDGWGKKLSYQLGITTDSVMDVSPRYTRQWNTRDYQARRRDICSSETTGELLVAQCRGSLRQGLPKSRFEELDRRTTLEQTLLDQWKKRSAWTDDEKHGRGRISGSLQWKVSRDEAGKTAATAEEANSPLACSLFVEQYYPQGTMVTIAVTPTAIDVSGATCDVGKSTGISVVVVDDYYLGCILQSRGFDSWDTFADFISTLPTNRIVAVKGMLDKDHEFSETTKQALSRLGSFVVPDNAKDGILYIGQVEATPGWTISTTYVQSTGIKVSIPKTSETKPQKLRTEPRAVPRQISGRLDENTMPLQTQLLASEMQKREAFLSFVEKNPENPVIGYTSKKGSPVYLLDASSFPFDHSDDLTTGVWSTFHFLPQPLVPENDVGVSEEGDKPKPPPFDIPVETTFFSQLFGPSLLVKANGVPTLMDTANALHNTRLVAMYFSAHWCGPCRSFTPMLAELYSCLKDTFPSHGLEIVFVSSDRDIPSFDNYFASMPWLAIPFQVGAMVQQQLKMKYGVRGIPSLVVLDAISGEIVVNMAEARGEVMQACRGGDENIESMLYTWLGRIPTESQDIVQLLELSVQDDDDSAKGGNDAVEPPNHSYCLKSSRATLVKPTVDPSERIKELFSKFVSEGSEPNAAAAKAIQLVTEERSRVHPTFGVGPLDNVEWSTAVYTLSGKHEDATFRTKSKDKVAVEMESSDAVGTCIGRIQSLYPSGNDAVVPGIKDTLSKYLVNAIRDPSNPKYRSMKLSNKFVDRISRVQGGLELVTALGLQMYPTSQDFCVCIPLHVNLDKLKVEVEKM
jgi:thiol-disulfide isomerase/thioredoxin